MSVETQRELTKLQIAEIFELPVHLLDVKPEQPCEINPENRRYLCLNEEDHAADVEALFACGCVVGYCQTGFERFLRVIETEWEGMRCIQHHSDTWLVAVEPLR